MNTAFLISLFCVVAFASAMPASEKSEFPTSNLLSRYDFNEISEPDFDDKEFDAGSQIPIVFFYSSANSDISDMMDEEENDSEENIVNEIDDGDTLIRNKRQSVRNAMDLSLTHTDRNGNDRRPGRIHGRVDLQGSGNNRKNYHATGGIGAGSVLWRSNNRKHSLGAGAYVQQHRGSFQGYNYKSKPNYGGGLGYRFRF